VGALKKIPAQKEKEKNKETQSENTCEQAVNPAGGLGNLGEDA